VSNRLVLLSGTPRAGTSSIAAACAERATESGYRTQLIDLYDADLVELRHGAWGHLTGLLTDWLRIDGVTLPAADALVTVPGVDEFLLLRHLAVRLRERSDITVVDAGQTDALLRMVTWLETLERLGIASTWLRAEIAKIIEVLFDAQATIRIVTTPDDATDALASIAGLTLAGFHVDGVIVNRVPRKKSSWPKAWVKQQRERAKAVDAGDIPVSRIALGKVRISLARDCGLDTAWTPQPRSTVEADGDNYVWTVPLIDPLHQSVRVGQLDSGVLVEVGTYRRYLVMPALVQRCSITRADVFADHIALHCEPNADVWPT
jgi:hypothetical protein